MLINIHTPLLALTIPQTFTRWINGYICQRGLRVENLEKDLNDGVILINLLEILTGKNIERYYKTPKSRTYMIANNSIALAFMAKQKLGVNCSAQGNDKFSLSFHIN